MPTAPDRGGLSRFALRVVAGLAILAVVLLLWQLRQLLLVVFAAVLLAALLRTLAEPLSRHTHLASGWSVGLVVLGLFLLILVGGTSLGAQLAAQFSDLGQRLPETWETLRRGAGNLPFGEWLLGQIDGVTDNIGGALDPRRAAGALSATFGMIGEVLLIVFLGIYLAVDPTLYMRGVVLLVPPRGREVATEAMVAVGHALQGWLLGQLIAMSVVGVLTWLGLWLLDVPMALALAVLAFLLEFIPVIGPFLAAIPGVAIALTESPTMALWVAMLYLLIQQIEGNILTPFVQRWAVDLPPALTLSAVAGFGLLFGWTGVILATPLMVAAMVMVRKVYIDAILEAPGLADSGARPMTAME